MWSTGSCPDPVEMWSCPPPGRYAFAMSHAAILTRDNCGGTAAGLLAAGISRWTGRRRGDRAALAVVTGTGPADREHAAWRNTAIAVTTSRRNERILPSRAGAPAT